MDALKMAVSAHPDASPMILSLDAVDNPAFHCFQQIELVPEAVGLA